MKVLVVGGGGREHAICWKLAQSPKVTELYCAPGNGGIAQVAQCVPIKATDVEAMVAWAKEHAMDFVMVAPDDPLALGMVDALEAAGIPAFGPRANAAVIEASKAFSKELMKKYHIPTAKYETFTDMDGALAYVRAQGAPIVVKADGLALGKGVVVAATVEEAEEAVRSMMQDHKFGASGSTVVIEECMVGPEVTVLAFCDGEHLVPMLSSQDHKRAYDGDEGPNTGGMGAYSPLPFVTGEDERYALERIMQPVADAMCAEGCPFTGVLYGGLMKTRDGIKVIEFNARFGDPETEVVLPRLKSDIVEIFSAVADGWELEHPLEWHDFSTVGVVLASKGYPGNYAKGAVIEGLDEVDGAVYHMGTASKEGRIVTAGGRVAIVVCAAPTLGEALEKCNREVGKVRCGNLYHRTDIGRKAIK